VSTDQLAARLATIVGEPHVLSDPAIIESYEVDWTGRWRGEARLVVRPASADEVSRVVVACAAVGAPIVPQGGNTGLVGGGVPADLTGAVVLSLRRLAWLGPVDPIAGQVVVGAGATLADVQRHARAAGWDLGLDFAARDSATVGGAVATNAGGTHVLRYGTARAHVVDVEAVLADGRILSRPRPAHTHSHPPAAVVDFDPHATVAGSVGDVGASSAQPGPLAEPADAPAGGSGPAGGAAAAVDGSVAVHRGAERGGAERGGGERGGGERGGAEPRTLGPVAGGLVKDSAGYDLPGLFAGSEGTLAILTAVRLRLVPLLPARVVALLGVDGTAAAQRVLGAVQRRVPDLAAAELLHADGLALVREHGALPPPLGVQAPTYLLLECAGWTDPTDALATALNGLPEVRDAAVAADAPGRAALWRYREAHPEAINASGVPVKLDVAVPAAALPAAEDAIRRAVAAVAPAARTILFGHLAEANLHVNVLDATGAAEAVSDAVLRVVADLGGSISAEHGIGRAKPRWLALTRSPVEISAMRAIKSALDPAGLLNPGALLP